MKKSLSLIHTGLFIPLKQIVDRYFFVFSYAADCRAASFLEGKHISPSHFKFILLTHPTVCTAILGHLLYLEQCCG
jgi:hypothetical protein